MPSLVA